MLLGWLVDWGLTPQSNYGNKRRRRVGLWILLPSSAFLNVRHNLHTQLNIPHGGCRMWAMFTPPGLLVPSTRGWTSKAKLVKLRLTKLGNMLAAICSVVLLCSRNWLCKWGNNQKTKACPRTCVSTLAHNRPFGRQTCFSDSLNKIY